MILAGDRGRPALAEAGALPFAIIGLAKRLATGSCFRERGEIGIIPSLVNLLNNLPNRFQPSFRSPRLRKSACGAPALFGEVLEDTVDIAKASFQSGLDGGQPISDGHAASPDYHALTGDCIELISNCRYPVPDYGKPMADGCELVQQNAAAGTVTRATGTVTIADARAFADAGALVGRAYGPANWDAVVEAGTSTNDSREIAHLSKRQPYFSRHLLSRRLWWFSGVGWSLFGDEGRCLLDLRFLGSSHGSLLHLF